MKHTEENRATYKDVSGIILSGGKSLRIGTDKALLKLGNETIIERVTNLMKSLFQKVFIIINTPSEYRFLNVQLYEDIYKQKGPLSGIHSGLTYSQTEKNFIISCDIPLMSPEMIKYIVEFKSDKPVRYCEAAGHHHHLAGIYSKSLLPEIEKIFSTNVTLSDRQEKVYSIQHLLKNIETEIIHPEELPFYSDKLFFNLNTNEDFEYLKRIWKPSRLV